MNCDDCDGAGEVDYAPVDYGGRQDEPSGVCQTCGGTGIVPASSPDDIRAAGWSVAVHNDYRLDGKAYTFWLFTKGDRCVKGEGETDAQALDVIRAALGMQEPG